MVFDRREAVRFVAADGSLLCELFNPRKRKNLKLRYSLAHACVKPGQRTRPHRLRYREVYYILAGRGIMHIDGEQKKVGKDCAVYIPAYCRQWIENTGRKSLLFLCIVEPAWEPVCELDPAPD